MKNYVFVGQDSVFFCSKLSVTISNPDFFVETESARNGLKALYILACEFSDGSISSKPEAVGAWHEFCRDRGNLLPVAVIHSSLAEVEEVHQVQPYLEITSGPWVRGQVKTVSESILKYTKLIFVSKI